MSQNNLLVSFLGLGIAGKGYETTKYYLNTPDDFIETKFIVIAICKFYKIEQLIIFTTKSVKESASSPLSELKEELFKNKINLLEEEIIPEGKNLLEQKEIFKKILNVLEKYRNYNFYLDITHGFRSLPLIFFSSLLYLNNIYNYHIEKIFYGAYEAGDKNKKETPIFDLSYLIELIEWSTGVNLFMNRYDSFFLEKLINKKYKNLNPKSFSSLKSSFKSFSNEFSNVRVTKISEKAKSILISLDKLKKELEQDAPYLIPMLDKTKEDIDKLTLEDPKILDINQLKFQITLMEKYLEKNLILQSVVLLREFIVSFVLFKINKTDKWDDYEFRQKVIKFIFINDPFSALNDEEIEIKNSIKKIDSIDKIQHYLNNIKNIRNNFVHAGFGGKEESLDNLSDQIKQILKELKKLL